MTKRETTLKEVTTIDIDGLLLKTVINNLTELLVEYGENAQISKESYRYEDDWYIALLVPTPETDEEMNKRLKHEANDKRLRDEFERKEFERLAAKFAKEPKQ